MGRLCAAAQNRAASRHRRTGVGLARDGAAAPSSTAVTTSARRRGTGGKHDEDSSAQGGRSRGRRTVGSGGFSCGCELRHGDLRTAETVRLRLGPV
jgi:hypothetical protein